MIESHHVVVVPGAPDDVFAFLADPANESRWNPDLLRRTSEHSGPIGLGTLFSGDYRHVGRIDSRIAEYDPPARLAFESEGAQARMTLAFRFEPDGAGATRMTVDGAVALRGPLRFAEPAMRGAVRTQFHERAEAIVRALS